MKTTRQTVRRRKQAAGRGFTLLEVVFAMGLLGFALLALFALHIVAIGANRHSGRLSTCMMLAQQQMEYLMGLPFPWDGESPTDLMVTASDPSTTANPYAHFAHPTGTAGQKPDPINALGGTSAADGPLMFYRTWDVAYPFEGDTSVLQLKVRVLFYDKSNQQAHGVTISSFRYKDQ